MPIANKKLAQQQLSEVVHQVRVAITQQKILFQPEFFYFKIFGTQLGQFYGQVLRSWSSLRYTPIWD